MKICSVWTKTTLSFLSSSVRQKPHSSLVQLQTQDFLYTPTFHLWGLSYCESGFQYFSSYPHHTSPSYPLLRSSSGKIHTRGGGPSFCLPLFVRRRSTWSIALLGTFGSLGSACKPWFHAKGSQWRRSEIVAGKGGSEIMVMSQVPSEFLGWASQLRALGFVKEKIQTQATVKWQQVYLERGTSHRQDATISEGESSPGCEFAI